jgi:hypothetical protein
MRSLKLSETIIIKSASFEGKNIVLTAEISNPQAEYIATLSGPPKKFVMWKKIQHNYMWINGLKLTVPNLISFFRIYASNPLDSISNLSMLKYLEFDLDYSNFSPLESYSRETTDEFYRALKSKQQTSGHYSNALQPITKTDGKIEFTIRIPQNAPIGKYTLKLGEFEDKQPKQLEFMTFKIQSTPMNTYIANLAQQSPIFYAIIGIIIAVFSGLLTGIFIGRK